MSVLFITSSLEKTGGWGRYSSALITEIQKHTSCEAATEDGSGDHKLSSKINLLSFILNCIRLRKASQKHDIIHALDGWPYAIYGYFSILGTEKKLFITAVGTYSVAPLYAPIKKLLLSRAYKRAEQTLCISAYTCSEIVKVIDHIPNRVVLLGTTVMNVPKESEIESYKKQISLSDQSPILLTVGGIKDRKGQLETVKAVHYLRAKYPDILYIMVGYDADQYYLKNIESFVHQNELKKNVKIIRKATDAQLSILYAIADVYCLNSTNKDHHFEGFGLTILEAAQFGTPAVGSRNSGIESAIRDGYNGLLATQRDPVDIGEKIARILGSNYEQFSEHAREFQKEFRWEKTADIYAFFYASKD